MSVKDTSGSEGRFSSSGFFVRLLVAVALPVALVGAGLWWLVGNDRVERSIDLRATDQFEVMNLVLDDNLGVDSDGSAYEGLGEGIPGHDAR